MARLIEIEDTPTRSDGQHVYWDATDSIHKYEDPASGTFVGASVKNSAAINLTNGSFTVLTFDTEDYDTDALHDGAANTSRLTIPTGKGGYYVAVACVEFTGSTAGNRRALEFLKNGTSRLDGTMMPDMATSVSSKIAIASRPLALVATDYIEVQAFVDGASLQALQVADYSPTFALYKVG